MIVNMRDTSLISSSLVDDPRYTCYMCTRGDTPGPPRAIVVTDGGLATRSRSTAGTWELGRWRVTFLVTIYVYLFEGPYNYYYIYIYMDNVLEP